MIFFGSCASYFHGLLPPWRKGKLADVDVYMDKPRNTGWLMPSQHVPGLYYYAGYGPRYEVFTGSGPYALLKTLPDNVVPCPVALRPLFARLTPGGDIAMVSSVLTQFVLKRAIVKALPLRKTQLDLEYYVSLLGTKPPLSVQHMAIEAAMKRESERLRDTYNLGPRIAAENAKFDEAR